jgi:hypothetical protein
VGWVDDTIVPESGGGIVRMTLFFVFVKDGLLRRVRRGEWTEGEEGRP